MYQIAIPWQDVGLKTVTVGKTISMALVLNDHDNVKAPMGGGRGRIRWFSGLDSQKNPAHFGDVTLVMQDK
jgi:hypothetical protein